MADHFPLIADGTANQIWESMRYFAEDMGLKEKED